MAKPWRDADNQRLDCAGNSEGSNVTYGHRDTFAANWDDTMRRKWPSEFLMSAQKIDPNWMPAVWFGSFC